MAISACSDTPQLKRGGVGVPKLVWCNGFQTVFAGSAMKLSTQGVHRDAPSLVGEQEIDRQPGATSCSATGRASSGMTCIAWLSAPDRTGSSRLFASRESLSFVEVWVLPCLVHLQLSRQVLKDRECRWSDRVRPARPEAPSVVNKVVNLGGQPTA